jgi:hypothetical protein
MQDNLVQRLRDRAYGCKVPDPLVEEAADEIDRLRLTDAEREAVEFAVEHLQNSGWGTAVLRGLLERTKTL